MQHARSRWLEIYKNVGKCGWGLRICNLLEMHGSKCVKVWASVSEDMQQASRRGGLSAMRSLSSNTGTGLSCCRCHHTFTYDLTSPSTLDCVTLNYQRIFWRIFNPTNLMFSDPKSVHLIQYLTLVPWHIVCYLTPLLKIDDKRIARVDSCRLVKTPPRQICSSRPRLTAERGKLHLKGLLPQI